MPSETVFFRRPDTSKTSCPRPICSLRPYRNLALFTAVVGTLRLWRYAQAQGMAAFAAVVFLFAGALVAIVAVILALRQRDSGMVIQNLLLML